MIVVSASVSLRSSEEFATLGLIFFSPRVTYTILVTRSFFLQYFTSFYFLYVNYQPSQLTFHIYESAANRFNI